MMNGLRHKLSKTLFRLKRHPRLSRWLRPAVRRVEPDQVWLLPAHESAPLTDVEVWGFQDAILDVNSGVIFKNSAAVEGTFRLPESNVERLEFVRMAPAVQPTMELAGAVASLDWIWSTNYFHFMRDTLTMVHALRALPADLPLTLLTHHGLPSGGEELVKEILPNSQIRSLPHLSRVRAPLCVFARTEMVAFDASGQVLRGFDQMPHSLRLLLQKMWREMHPPTLPHRIFLGRGDVRHRRLLNEPEIAEMLGTRGFEPLFLTGRTLAEQFELFRNAEAIVAVRGATIANLAAISHPLKFISIRPTDETETIVRSMVERGELIYGEVRGDGRDKNDDFRIDPAALASELDRLGIH